MSKSYSWLIFLRLALRRFSGYSVRLSFSKLTFRDYTARGLLIRMSWRIAGVLKLFLPFMLLVDCEPVRVYGVAGVGSYLSKRCLDTDRVRFVDSARGREAGLGGNCCCC